MCHLDISIWHNVKWGYRECMYVHVKLITTLYQIKQLYMTVLPSLMYNLVHVHSVAAAYLSTHGPASNESVSTTPRHLVSHTVTNITIANVFVTNIVTLVDQQVVNMGFISLRYLRSILQIG